MANRYRKNRNKPSTKKEEYFVRIIYKDHQGKNRDVKLPFKDAYDEKSSYRNNMENLASNIYDEGGFWPNADTIIPHHRILAFKAVKVSPSSADTSSQKSKPKRRVPRTSRRTPPTTTSTTTSNEAKNESIRN